MLFEKPDKKDLNGADVVHSVANLFIIVDAPD